MLNIIFLFSHRGLPMIKLCPAVAAILYFKRQTLGKNHPKNIQVMFAVK